MWNHPIVKWHKVTQRFAILDYVGEMTSKKTCKYEEYSSFELFFFFNSVCILVIEDWKSHGVENKFLVKENHEISSFNSVPFNCFDFVVVLFLFVFYSCMWVGGGGVVVCMLFGGEGGGGGKGWQCKYDSFGVEVPKLCMCYQCTML